MLRLIRTILRAVPGTVTYKRWELYNKLLVLSHRCVLIRDPDSRDFTSCKVYSVGFEKVAFSYCERSGKMLCHSLWNWWELPINRIMITDMVYDRKD